MAEQWYVARNNERHGPFTARKMKELGQAGKLASNDLVWKEGMSEWRPAGQVNGLISPFPDQPDLPVMPPPPPIRKVRGGTPSLAGDLSGPLRSAAWVKGVSGAGLLFVLIGLVCPWYSNTSSATVDMTGLNGMSGFDNRRPGQSARGGGVSISDDGMGRSSASITVSITGITTLPGVLATLGLLVAGALSFLPWRWAAVGATVAGGLILLAVVVSLVYAPSVNQGESFGGPGMGFSRKHQMSFSWGQFVTALGGLPVIVGPVLALLGVGLAGSGAANSASFLREK